MLLQQTAVWPSEPPISFSLVSLLSLLITLALLISGLLRFFWLVQPQWSVLFQKPRLSFQWLPGLYADKSQTIRKTHALTPQKTVFCCFMIAGARQQSLKLNVYSFISHASIIVPSFFIPSCSSTGHSVSTARSFIVGLVHFQLTFFTATPPTHLRPALLHTSMCNCIWVCWSQEQNISVKGFLTEHSLNQALKAAVTFFFFNPLSKI